MSEVTPDAGPERIGADALLRPVARLLRPLVRLLLRNGVTYPVFADLLRGLFVEVGREMLPPGARTDSGLSVLTGVHRKELRRQRAGSADADAVPAVVTLASQVIARWVGDPAWLDGDGRPLPLHRSARAGEKSFEALVRSVTRDVRARAVLEDWLGQGLVGLDEDGRVRLRDRAFIPPAGGAEQLYYFARNLHDHLAAAAENVGAAGGPRHLDASVHYDALPAAVADRLEQVAREAGRRVLIEVNREAIALLADLPPAAAGEPTRRVNLGVYLYGEAEPPVSDGTGGPGSGS